MSITSSGTTDTLPPLPFPEWSDAALNAEVWEPPKEKAKDAPPIPIVPFVDNQKVLLPSSIASKVAHWKRAADVFKAEKLVVYEDKSSYSKLADGSNDDLFDSEFVRHFISSIGIMEYMGSNKTLVMEGVSAKYLPNTENEPWKAWHHVYSLTKAGKGQKHRPQVNQTGKYVVRLFWMGCWRRVTVDDKLPVDAENNVLLPSLPKPVPKKVESDEISVHETPPPSPPSKGKVVKKPSKKIVKEEPKEIMQIWPFILTKALLKIASLTWTECKEIVDFDIISCLTGWIVQKIDTRILTFDDKWEICRQFSNHYTWTDDIHKSASGVTKTRSKLSIKSKKTAGSSKSDSRHPAEKLKLPLPFYLVGICKDLSSCEDNEVPDIGPCCSHLLLFDQSRDIPLIKPDPKPELERWKMFRWLAWAIQKGLIEPPADMEPIKCIKLVSTLRHTNEIPTEEAACIKMSVEVIDEVAEEVATGKNKGNKATGSTKSTASSKVSKSTGSDKSKKGSPLSDPLPDISIWCDFNNIWQHIDYLHIYFKLTAFEHKTTVTNMAEIESNTDPRAKIKTPSVLIHSQLLNQFKNEPLYIFVDSLDYKFIVFNLVQPGLTNNLKKPEKNLPLNESPKTSKELVICVNSDSDTKFVGLLEIIRSRRNLRMSIESHEERTPSGSIETQLTEEAFSMGHLIVEDYDWQSERTSNIRLFLNSLGAKASLTNLEQGRFCLRLWIETEDRYILNILSDISLTIGNLELVLDNMKTESHRLMNFCFKISSAYGQLVQSLGTPDYVISLKKFYNSLKPDVKYKKRDFERICEHFFDKLLEYLQKNFNQHDYKKTVAALRILFLNTKLGYAPISDKLQIKSAIDVDPSLLGPDEMLILKEIERAAVVIQAFFKRIYVRILKKRQNTAEKSFMNTFDHLKKVYTTCFSVEKRLTVCLNFLRDILQRPDVSNFFSWIKDLNTVIDVESFNGSSSVTFANWIPISRYLFYCQPEHPTIAKICLFGEIEQCLIRVFDNDSGKEMPRHTYNCNAYKYHPNKKGYSVLCYGWTTESKNQLNWRLMFITTRQQPDHQLNLKDANLETNTLTMGYIPNNSTQQIFTCNLTIQQDTLATLRLCTSHESAKLLLKCLKNNKLLAKICGNGNIILPSVFLECETAPLQIEDEPPPRKSSLNLKRKRSISKSGFPLDGSRKFKETKSDKTSVSSKTDHKSDILTKLASKEGRLHKKETLYTVEGFVLENTWPLSVEEWAVVREWKKRRLVGAPAMSLQKMKENNSNSRMFMDNHAVEKPFWCLQTVFNRGDSVSVSKDTMREDEIKNVKRTWYTTQPGRYPTSQKYRTDHLEALELEKCSSESSEALSEVLERRTSKSPELIKNIQHTKWLLKKYSTAVFSETSLLDRELQTLEHDQNELAYRVQKIEEFERYHEKFKADMSYFLLNQLERCSVLKMFITNCRTESATIMEGVQEKRKQYVEMVCPPSPVTQKGKRKSGK